MTHISRCRFVSGRPSLWRFTCTTRLLCLIFDYREKNIVDSVDLLMRMVKGGKVLFTGSAYARRHR